MARVSFEHLSGAEQGHSTTLPRLPATIGSMPLAPTVLIRSSRVRVTSALAEALTATSGATSQSSSLVQSYWLITMLRV